MIIKSNTKIGLIFIFIFLCILTLFYLSRDHKFAPNGGRKEEKRLLEVSIDQNGLLPDSTNLIFCDTLKPHFYIKYKEPVEIQDIYIDKINILSDSFLIKEDDVTQEKGFIYFTLPFLLKPTYHSFKIKIKEGNGFILEKDFSFTLGLRNDFNQTIQESDLFHIPELTKKKYEKSWFVEESKLKIGSVKIGGHASLSFLYPFTDVYLSFELKPHGEKINLDFYFLNKGRGIVIGNGNNSRITFLRGSPYLDNSVEGRKLEMMPGKTYSVFIHRDGNNYRLFILEGVLDMTREKISEEDLLLDFKDAKEIDYTKEDYVGFSVWEGSDGLEIDNLSISIFNPHGI